MRLLFALWVLTFSGVVYARSNFQGVPVYDLEVAVRPADRFLSVSGTAVIPPAKTAQSRLYFQLAIQMRSLRVEIVSPESSIGVLDPKMVSDNGLGTGNWSAELPRQIDPGIPVTVKFSYEGGDKTAFVFHIGSDGAYADGSDIAWYPEFGAASTTGKFSVDGIEQVVGKVSYEIPSDLQIVANGRGSEPSLRGHSKIVSFKTEHPSALGFVVDHFRVLRGDGKVPVSLYLKSDLGDEKAFINGIQKVVDLLTSIYGPFPFPEFSLVELSDEATAGAGFGGAGCAGYMMSTTSFLDQGFNYAFFGHEIGHQWWGNLVTHAAEKEGDDLLDEALAQYGSLYCVNHLIGPAAAKGYRTVGYPGYVMTQCGMHYLNMIAAGFDHELESMDSSTPLAHELACEKGFLVYDQLRREIGDEAFHRGLQSVTRDYAFRSVTLAEFKHKIERAAHRDLGWFWDQWLKRKGVPHLSVEWSQTGDFATGVLRQTKPYYRLHMPIAVRSEDGSISIVSVNLTESATPFRLRTKGIATGITIDPDFDVPHFTPELEERAREMIPVTKIEWAAFSDLAKTKELVDIGLKNLSGPDLYGVAFLLHYYHARFELQSKDFQAAAHEIEAALMCPNRVEELMPNCLQLLMECSSASKDYDRASWAARAVLMTEKELRQYTSASKAAENWLKRHPATDKAQN